MFGFTFEDLIVSSELILDQFLHVPFHVTEDFKINSKFRIDFELKQLKWRATKHNQMNELTV